MESQTSTTETPHKTDELSTTSQNVISTTVLSNTESTVSPNLFSDVVTEETSVSTTNFITTNPEPQDFTKQESEEISSEFSVTEASTTNDLTTATNYFEQTNSEDDLISSTTIVQEVDENRTTTTNDIETTSENIPTDSDNEITTENEGFGGTLKRNARSQNKINLIELNIVHNKRKRRSRRKARSLVDYLIARYYDDHFLRAYHGYRQIPYIPKDQPVFHVNGKYREHNINFMKYDTILPFYYIPHLDTLALSFPLDNTNYYLLLLLPIQHIGIDKLICDLRLNGSLRYIIENLQYRHVVATIPSFMLKGYVTLTPTFQKVRYHYIYLLYLLLLFV